MAVVTNRKRSVADVYRIYRVLAVDAARIACAERAEDNMAGAGGRR